jgi:hypothetical protein
MISFGYACDPYKIRINKLYKFSGIYYERGKLFPDVPWSKSSKFDQHLLLSVHQTCKNSKLKMTEDAQKHFESVFERC